MNIFDNINDGKYNPKTPYSKETREAYHKEKMVLYLQFKQDLFKEYGVENNPKRDKCFSLAWEHGHSAGYSEVAIYFSDFVELIKD